MVRADVRPSCDGARQPVSRRAAALIAVAVWGLGFVFTLATYTFSDDHFGRISPARQIARYGELPFRDYFDPGYVLTELASAGVQRVFGDNLLGEMLLTSSFVAGGAVAILMLVRRATGSTLLAISTAGVALLSSPRPYDYDKFLFYPLGLLVCWRYADAPTLRRLLVIAATVAVGGMFRYDNGLFVAICALVVIVLAHVREGAVLLRRAAGFAVACAVCAAPYLLFLELNGGLRDALDQTVTYARREGERTRIAQLPPIVWSELRFTRLPPPPPNRVQVRWASEVDRTALEEQYTLHNGVQRGDAADHTWLYEIRDVRTENLRALVNDPRVADTHLVDRRAFRLVPQERRLTRLRRQIPVIGLFTLSLSVSTAAAFVYYAFLAVSIATVWMVLRSPRASDRLLRPHIIAGAVMTLLVAIIVLREPVAARFAGAIGPAAVLAAWLWHRGAGHRVARALVTSAVVMVLAVAADLTATWSRFLNNARRMDAVLADATAAVPPLTLLPNPAERGLVEYVRRCTRPEDRVLALWFEPELYFFSRRGFGGGMVVTFGDHWSEPDHQRRIIRWMEQRPPMVFLRNARHADLEDHYPLVAAHLSDRFRTAGESTLGDFDGNVYTLLVPRDRPSGGMDESFSMPCFAAASAADPTRSVPRV